VTAAGVTGTTARFRGTRTVSVFEGVGVAEKVSQALARVREADSLGHVPGWRTRSVVRDEQEEAVLKACLFDRAVALQKLQLLAQRDIRAARVPQREAEEVRQPQNHALGGVGIRLQERGDRVERVEKKVRLKLHLQRTELRLHELGLEPGRGELAIAILRVGVGSPGKAHEHPVREDVRVKVQPEELREHQPEGARAVRGRVRQSVENRPGEEELEG
jgi:hypothetical protein